MIACGRPDPSSETRPANTLAEASRDPAQSCRRLYAPELTGGASSGQTHVAHASERLVILNGTPEGSGPRSPSPDASRGTALHDRSARCDCPGRIRGDALSRLIQMQPPRRRDAE